MLNGPLKKRGELLNAVLVFKNFFRERIPPPNVEALIQKNILPVREGRMAPGKVRFEVCLVFMHKNS